MYKYVGNLNNNIIGENGYLQAANDGNEDLLRFKQFKDRCGSEEELSARKDDGGTLEGWKLQGVLLVIRHGDRGPMSHVQGISSIDCGVDSSNILLKKYEIFYKVRGRWFILNFLSDTRTFFQIPQTLPELTICFGINLDHSMVSRYSHPLKGLVFLDNWPTSKLVLTLHFIRIRSVTFDCPLFETHIDMKPVLLYME